MVKPENQLKGLCVICSAKISQSFAICHRCRKKCELTRPEYSSGSDIVATVKSMCCGADVDLHAKTTCSDICHEEYVKFLEVKFGTHKKVEDAESGIAYRVPTRDIMERGLNQRDLPKYPRWRDGDNSQ